VAVVDDHALVRSSISMFVNSLKGIEVSIEACNGQDLLKKMKNFEADIVLLDIQMPVMDGYETCEQLNILYPHTRILMMSQLMSKESIHKSMEAGAHGYFSKDGDPKQLETALNTLSERGFYFEPGLGSVIHDAILWNKDSMKQNELSHLSEKEIEIIQLACKGYDNLGIAEALSINVRTVESYRARILSKTDVKSFTNVILMAIKYNYVDLDELLVIKTRS